MGRVERVDPRRLRPNEANPRSITAERFAALKRALIADPEMLEARPLMATDDGVVYAGNMRLRAAQELAGEGHADFVTIPVWYGTPNEALERSRVVRDNAGYGEWVEQELAELLHSMAQLGDDLDLSGLDTSAVTRLLDSIGIGGAAVPGVGGEDDQPEPPIVPVTKPGEVLTLGPHLVLCGDATSAEDRVALLDALQELHGRRDVALIFTSPPYGAARDYHGGDLTPEHLAGFVSNWKDDARLICCNLGILRQENEWVTYWDAYLAEARAAGLKLLSWNVWWKEAPATLAQNTAMFPVEHEWIFVWGKDRVPTHLVVPNKLAGEVNTSPGNRQTDGTVVPGAPKIIRTHRPLGTVVVQTPARAGAHGVDHPAQYPVELPRRYLEALTSRGDVVCDPFGGGGSTLIAAESIGRVCVLIEISPAYCDVIRSRYEQYAANRPAEPVEAS